MIILRLAPFALCATFFAMTAPAQTIQVSKENRTIAITATDKVIVLADIATLHIGFIAYGPDRSGVTERLRNDDGIHFTSAGYELVAERVISVLPSLQANER